MNKNDLVSHVAADFSASRNIAEHTITTSFFAISDAPARAEPVGITGFGKFAICSRAPHRGLNPKIGEPGFIVASGVPPFTGAAHNQMSAFPTRLEIQSGAPANSYAWETR